MSSPESAISKIFRSSVTLSEMFIDRKYTKVKLKYKTLDELRDATSLEGESDSPTTEVTSSITDVSKILYNKSIVLLNARNTKGEDVSVYWYGKINSKLVKYHLSQEEPHIFLIHESPIASQAKTLIKDVKNIRIELFMLAETLYNLTKHSYSPQYSLCSDEEKEEVLRKYAVSPDDLPRLLINEPAARYFGAEKGQIFRILRKDTVHKGEMSIGYRVVA